MERILNAPLFAQTVLDVAKGMQGLTWVPIITDPSDRNMLELQAGPQPSTFDPQPSTLNPQPSTLNPQPSTLDPRP